MATIHSYSIQQSLSLIRLGDTLTRPSLYGPFFFIHKTANGTDKFNRKSRRVDETFFYFYSTNDRQSCTFLNYIFM